MLVVLGMPSTAATPATAGRRPDRTASGACGRTRCRGTRRWPVVRSAERGGAVTRSSTGSVRGPASSTRRGGCPRPIPIRACRAPGDHRIAGEQQVVESDAADVDALLRLGPAVTKLEQTDQASAPGRPRRWHQPRRDGQRRDRNCLRRSEAPLEQQRGRVRFEGEAAIDRPRSRLRRAAPPPPLDGHGGSAVNHRRRRWIVAGSRRGLGRIRSDELRPVPVQQLTGGSPGSTSWRPASGSGSATGGSRCEVDCWGFNRLVIQCLREPYRSLYTRRDHRSRADTSAARKPARPHPCGPVAVPSGSRWVPASARCTVRVSARGSR